MADQEETDPKFEAQAALMATRGWVFLYLDGKGDLDILLDIEKLGVMEADGFLRNAADRLQDITLDTEIEWEDEDDDEDDDDD